MESQNNPSITKPSKRFLIRGGIATGILALILLIQTPWFLGIFSKKGAKGIVVTDATVGEIVGKDSNGNGIADWEESLWGLDPTVTTTNGVSNKVIIEQKRRSLQGAEQQNGELNETDRLARELFGFTTALGSENSVDKSSLGALAAKLGQENATADVVPVYALKNITTVQTNRKNLVSYEKNLFAILDSYDKTVPEIDIFITSIETGDYSTLEQFDTTISLYTELSKKLSKVAVPIGIAQYHLDITNSIVGIGKSFEKMKLLEDNGVSALVGLSEYRYHDQKLSSALEKLGTYLSQYGILQ
jgi:hypothetical protein